MQVYAAGCQISGDDAPTPSDAACILGRIFNIGFLVVGIIAIAILAYGAIKAATAFGDPKGLAGAHQTWLYGFIGFIIVVFAGALLTMIGNLFGLELVPNDLIIGLGTRLDELFEWVGTGD